MAVIIKNMDIPKYCEYCPLCRTYHENGNVWCNILNRILKQNCDCYANLNIEKPDDCPLEEIS